MSANLALSADLLRSSKDILEGKPNGKIYFFAACWSIKTIVFMELGIAEKLIMIFALVL